MAIPINIAFSAEDWAHIEQTWRAWWAHELERPLIMIEGGPPDKPHFAPLRSAATFALDTPVDTVLDDFQADLEQWRWYGDAWPRWYPNFGPGVVAAFLGAQVEVQNETVWFAPKASTGIQDLTLQFDPDNVWWQRVQALTRRAVARWGDRLNVGITDLGGNLDILASLVGSEALLYAFLDAPETAERLTQEITALWLRYYDALDALVQPSRLGSSTWAAVWAPERCYMLQSDLAYMISPEMFERFVLPDLATCCEHLDYPFYHLDGKGQLRHLDMLLSLENLRGIQWIPGEGTPPPEHWLPELKRIRDAGKLCQLYVSAEGAHTIVSELGYRGFAFFIIERMNEQEPRQAIEYILDKPNDHRTF
jgi:5-methyltetrahydrofolate--homocysteine methyltransferase